MSTAALSTRGLDKSFGSLVVAKNIELDLPRGARYALIGPNGAGKTTLINLITGMLRPDQGRIFLEADEVTALRPEERVKRGLVRTFQINTLFPHLSALEAVTLAVCERRGYAGTWWQKLPAYPDAVEEAYAILLSLRLAASCYRPTRELAYGQQRLLEIALALATDPKVLLLDEPAAGVPQGESAELFSVIADLSQDIAVLFIEHDMNVVFRFARRIIVMVGGRILVEGTPAEIAADAARARGLSRGGHHGWLRRCLRSRACAPVTATPSCSTASHSRSETAAASRCSGATASARRRFCSRSWASPASVAAPSPGAAATSRALLRMGAHATGSAGWRRSARFFPPSTSRKISRWPRGRDGGRWSRSTTCFPGSRSGAPAAAITSRAASSRCWRSRAR